MNLRVQKARKCANDFITLIITCTGCTTCILLYPLLQCLVPNVISGNKEVKSESPWIFCFQDQVLWISDNFWIPWEHKFCERPKLVYHYEKIADWLAFGVSAQLCRKLLSGLGVTTRPYCKEKTFIAPWKYKRVRNGGWGGALFPAWDLIGQDVLPEVDHLASLVGTTFSWNLLVWKKKNHRTYQSFHQIKEDVAANLSMDSGPWTAIA